jgi:transcriptional regulator with XRE-family HTH domain
MKKVEKISTEGSENLNNYRITDANDLFYKLLKVNNKVGLSQAELAAKTGKTKSMISRYINRFKSQSSCTPKLDFLVSLADVLGYEIRIVEKKSETHEEDI